MIFQGKWLYGLNPFEPLRFAKPLEALKAKLAAEGSKTVFSPLIQKFLLDNPHKVTVLLQVCT
jgi:Zn-dependent M16 (insulinase) family peptidase